MEEDVGLHQHPAVSFVDHNDKCIVSIELNILDSAPVFKRRNITLGNHRASGIETCLLPFQLSSGTGVA